MIEGKIFKHGTAEELAADEDVRRLYLGRNFELRRKDYLHEEARGHGKISLENIIRSVESAIAWSHKIDEADDVRLKTLGARLAAPNIKSDLGLDDYEKFLVELQQSLLQYATEKNDKDILSRANDLFSENSNIDADLSTILLFLKSQRN